MKALACKDMGMDCSFEVKHQSAEEVIKSASDHAMRVHPEKMKEMMKTMSETQMKQAMITAIKTT